MSWIDSEYLFPGIDGWVCVWCGRVEPTNEHAYSLAAAATALEEAEKRGLDISGLRVRLATRYLELGEHEAVVGLLGDGELAAEGCLILAKSLQVFASFCKSCSNRTRLRALPVGSFR